MEAKDQVVFGQYFMFLEYNGLTQLIDMASNQGVAILDERIKVLEKRIISSNPEKIKTSV